MWAKHYSPAPASIPVPLKIDANSPWEYWQHYNNVVLVQVWPFEEIMSQDLMDPFLFGDANNVVNLSNLWGKFISSGPNEKEMLTRQQLVRQDVQGVHHQS
jgi:hypothetical protein